MQDEVTITPKMNGPYYIKGRIRVTLPDGQELETEEETWLCRCGGSANKPFCDGTHKRIGFRADEGAARAALEGQVESE
ncbi:MAG TPA: CDGSH iron-sulfur domain-containing protein [Chloroflexota bacterium]|nr:CDGSH iron-sulfur domain-containing protein [Chloroflexota bacterium]